MLSAIVAAEQVLAKVLPVMRASKDLLQCGGEIDLDRIQFAIQNSNELGDVVSNTRVNRRGGTRI